MKRLKNDTCFLQGKGGIYFAVFQVIGILSLKSCLQMCVMKYFIAENGAMLSFMGEDMYEATMSQDFSRHF